MNLLKSLTAISFITILSRILGFIRDTIMARMFGVSIMTDAFFIAFKLPNLLRRIFAEGAFYQVFLPILSEYQSRESKEEIRVFISRVSALLIVTVTVVVFIGLLIAPWIIMVIAPGFNSSSEKFIMTIEMFRVMLPYILLVSLTSLMGAILNACNFFLVPAFTPIFLNISMISYMLFIGYSYFHISIMGLAWSVIVGGVLQCVYCLLFLKKINMLVIPKMQLYDNRVHRICRSMVPAVIAVSSSQVSLIINTVFASFLRDGSVSWMYYADRLMELPIGIFGVTLSTVLVPYLSRFISRKNYGDYFYLMNWGMRLCFILSLPSALILGVLSEPLVITLFKYGKFLEFDVLMTQYSVIAYAIGLPGLIFTKVLTSGFYALRDIKTPAYIVVIVLFFTQFINLVCINTLKHVVFSFSISLGAWLNAGLLYWKFKKKYLFQLQSGWLCFCCQLMIALFVMCIVCLGLLTYVSSWDQGNILYRLIRMIGALILVSSSYGIMLWCVGVRLKDFIFLSKDLY
ncbi:murein biosynthesis integral membrane protein MurJ [Candidatus Blochmanniella camponoti]|uniref:Probable lipid II flippase MurJ n=1 Tax=Candidatus Blochmanniella camponoti TaxID=108080 RepID=A0AAE9I6X0_9ENTR|nr:murein biosynthesis integral membrane protein MurJ [Candidatus Blochmannia herculeanus]URJ24823.1 murein biosynthesis integral membrane protein MurJ [Candidatus Blochmannia herculeanus]URJ27870.1 murein biosynthesis integral membrane protein MurJ [Candidatus Blochmannia herculeanus]